MTTNDERTPGATGHYGEVTVTPNLRHVYDPMSIVSMPRWKAEQFDRELTDAKKALEEAAAEAEHWRGATVDDEMYERVVRENDALLAELRHERDWGSCGDSWIELMDYFDFDEEFVDGPWDVVRGIIENDKDNKRLLERARKIEEAVKVHIRSICRDHCKYGSGYCHAEIVCDALKEE